MANRAAWAAGGVLILVALVLAAVQDLRIVNIYGSADNKWYFYGIVTFILVAGIALVAWGLRRRKTKPTSQK